MRFPDAASLEAELTGAGFASVAVTPHERATTISRDDALARVRGKHISTFQLIAADEYAAGLERAERELPAEVEVGYGWLVVVASA